MKTGAVMMAFNNEHYNYVQLAAWNADNIRRHLKIPVCLITDEIDVPDKFDDVIRVEKPVPGQRYFPDVKSVGSWYNSSRCEVLEMSPYDRTLLLDADYVICSTSLKWALETNKPFLCFKNAYDITTTTDFSGLNSFGAHNYPMHWATVMIFDKCQHSKFIFDSMQMIRDHWDHYRNIYKIDRPTYRNDYALSIALGIVSGHTLAIEALPYQMTSIMPEHRLSKIDDNFYKVNFMKNNRAQHLTFYNMDFHAMGKRDLGEFVGT